MLSFPTFTRSVEWFTSKVSGSKGDWADVSDTASLLSGTHLHAYFPGQLRLTIFDDQRLAALEFVSLSSDASFPLLGFLMKPTEVHCQRQHSKLEWNYIFILALFSVFLLVKLGLGGGGYVNMLSSFLTSNANYFLSQIV